MRSLLIATFCMAILMFTLQANGISGHTASSSSVDDTVCPHGGRFPLLKDGTPDFEPTLLKMSIGEVWIGILLTVGTAVAVAPQLVHLLRTQSSAGLSHWSLFMNLITQYLSILSLIVMKAPQLLACRQVGLWRCSPSLLSLAQGLILWLVSLPIYVLFLRYCKNKRERAEAERVYYVHVCICVLCMAFSVYLLDAAGPCADATRLWAHTLGVITTILTTLQFLPQIQLTRTTGQAGALSLTAMFIQLPGTVALTLYIAVTLKEHINVWISYAVSAVQQAYLMWLVLRGPSAAAAGDKSNRKRAIARDV